MERTRPQVNTTSELTRVNGNGATPFSQQTVGLTKQAYIELKWKVNDWQAQYERLLKREAALKAEVEALGATIRDLKTVPGWHLEREIRRLRRCWRVKAGELPQAGSTA